LPRTRGGLEQGAGELRKGAFEVVAEEGGGEGCLRAWAEDFVDDELGESLFLGLELGVFVSELVDGIGEVSDGFKECCVGFEGGAEIAERSDLFLRFGVPVEDVGEVREVGLGRELEVFPVHFQVVVSQVDKGLVGEEIVERFRSTHLGAACPAGGGGAISRLGLGVAAFAGKKIDCLFERGNFAGRGSGVSLETERELGFVHRREFVVGEGDELRYSRYA
jgi:hypothetical protein